MTTELQRPEDRIRPHGGGNRFVLHLDERDSVGVDAPLRAELLRRCAAGVALLVLDASDVRDANSAVLGLILLCRRLVLGVGGHLRLAGVGPHLRDVLRATRLMHMLDCRPDLAAALADDDTPNNREGDERATAV